MRYKLQLELAHKYWFMRRNTGTDQSASKNQYTTIGIECFDSWYQLLDNMCAEILSLYDEFPDAPIIMVSQVKDKYARLNFSYSRWDNESEAKEWGVDFPIGTPTRKVSANKETIRQFGKRLSGIIEKYENASEKTCERCAKPSKVRYDRYWLSTLCDECFNRGRDRNNDCDY